jgi:hypothetical protein
MWMRAFSNGLDNFKSPCVVVGFTILTIVRQRSYRVRGVETHLKRGIGSGVPPWFCWLVSVSLGISSAVIIVSFSARFGRRILRNMSCSTRHVEGE